MLSAICRPQAEPIISTYLRIKFSMIVPVSPVSSIVLGSAGRKLSSERIEASRLLPEVVELAVSVADITNDSLTDGTKPTTGQTGGQTACAAQRWVTARVQPRENHSER